MRDKIQTAVARVRSAVERFSPMAIVGLFSGGHDSTAANLIAHEAGADFSLHINTGIGIEQTRQYVGETCAARGWTLKEYKATENTYADGAPAPMVYEDIVRANGFPGPFAHRAMYVKLKDRQLRRFEREIGATTKNPVLYLTGVRSDESQRRMGNTTVTAQKTGRQVWVNHIHDFTKLDCGNCMKHFGQPRNNVVDLIHKSGECLCGAFAKHGELAELKIWFPDVAKRIEDLEHEVASKWPWRWEDPGPPQWFKEKKHGQTFMPGFEEMAMQQPLCRKCNLAMIPEPTLTTK